MKALILVGGFGTRLRPLTFTKPKPIVPFVNKAILLHQVEALVACGVQEIVLAVSYRPEDMEAFLADAEEKYGVKIVFSVENEPLGTAGPLALAKDILKDGGEPFFVMNSDVICSFPLLDFLHFHRAHGQEGTLMVTEVSDPSKYGVVVADEQGKIEQFVEKPQVFVGNKINAGIYLLNPSVLERIEPRPTSIEREIFPKMALEQQLYRYVLPGYWMDIGQPKDYLKGQHLHLESIRTHHSPEALSSGSRIIGNVIIHPSADVHETAVIGPDVVIGPNVVVKEGVRMKNTAVLEGATIDKCAFVDTAIIGWNSRVGAWARLTDLVVVGEGVQIRAEISLEHCRVAPHKSIKASLPAPSTTNVDIM